MHAQLPLGAEGRRRARRGIIGEGGVESSLTLLNTVFDRWLKP